MRSGAHKVEAKGMFVGAEVVRGHDWKWGYQDGESYGRNSTGLALPTDCMISTTIVVR